MSAPPENPERKFLFPKSSESEELFLARFLRQETVGGAVVLAAAVIAVIWANSGFAEAYEAVRTYELGPLDVEHWAADGALALFFYIAGLEVKREFVVGSLSKPADALVPIMAAAGGVAIPALIYVALNLSLPDGEPTGWAIPAATDIAFALAVLAVVGRHLPSSLRAFLLTLAVVDDLIVIIIIAIFYTDKFDPTSLGIALVLLAVFAFFQTIRGESWVVYVPLALAIWWFTHESGVHATVAGVMMGLATRVKLDEGEDRSPAERLEHTLTPLSAGLAVPFFALMSAGVAVSGGSELLTNPIVLGVVLGLVLGKPIGVLGGAWLTTRFTKAELNEDLTWRDLAGVATLAGVGFTVALLVSDLSFTGDQAEAAKTAVLGASVVAAGLAAVILHRRSNVRAPEKS